MPRMYVVNSWVGAAEYDEGDTYSGEQIGNRNQKSVGVHILRDGDQWKANVAAYSDDTLTKKPTVKKKKITETIIPQSATLNRLDEQESELYKAFENEEISHLEFTQCLNALELKRGRAWKSYEKAIGASSGADEQPPPSVVSEDRPHTLLAGLNSKPFVEVKSKPTPETHTKRHWKEDATTLLLNGVLLAVFIYWMAS